MTVINLLAATSAAVDAAIAGVIFGWGSFIIIVVAAVVGSIVNHKRHKILGRTIYVYDAEYVHTSPVTGKCIAVQNWGITIRTTNDEIWHLQWNDGWEIFK